MDYFETESVVKEYDSKIIKRIFSYIKKYKGLLFLTILALFITTVGELLVPVLTQRLIDDAIMLRYLKIDLADGGIAALSKKSKNELAELEAEKRVVKIGRFLFVPETTQLGMSSAVKNELEKSSVLDKEQWYVFAIGRSGGRDKEKSAQRIAIIKKYPELFMLNGNAGSLVNAGSVQYAAMKKTDLSKLSLEENEVIRSFDIRKVYVIAGVLLIVLLFVFVATFGQTYTASLIGQRVMRTLRVEIFNKTAHFSTAFLSLNPVGRIVTRITSDVETINDFFTSVVVALLKDVSLMIGVLITLFYLSPRLACVAFVCLPPVIIATAIGRIKNRDAFRRQRIASSSVNSYLSEHLSLLNIVQLFRREAKSKSEYWRRNRELLDANISEIKVFAVFRPVVDFFSVVTTAVVIAAGAALVLDLTISLGVLIAFINLIAMFFAPVLDIAEKYTLLQSAMAGGERVFDLLDKNESIPDKGPQYTKTIRGNIEFKDVCFSYKSGERVIKNLSFKVSEGEQIAVVGYTGAGKSTIINILTRLWDIDSGAILLDGTNIKDIPLSTLRANIVPVLQNVFLFSGTIAENISLGLNLSKSQIEDAARAVHANQFIEKLPQGYDTIISEGAGNISGGERQLISFARVIAHNPRVVILDEATSSVDSETEKLIQEGMKTVLRGRTSIVIAHRLSTIKNADRIFVISNGALVEDGSHDELIAKGGFYALLSSTQADLAVDPRQERQPGVV